MWFVSGPVKKAMMPSSPKMNNPPPYFKGPGNIMFPGPYYFFSKPFSFSPVSEMLPARASDRRVQGGCPDKRNVPESFRRLSDTVGVDSMG